jgi:hypothetical protein
MLWRTQELVHPDALGMHFLWVCYGVCVAVTAYAGLHGICAAQRGRLPVWQRYVTERGVVYRFGWRFYASPLLVAISLCTLAAPLYVGVASAVFLATGAYESHPLLTAAAGLFVIQMAVAALLIASWLRGVWRNVGVSLFGRYELELDGGRLYLGQRLGRYRFGRWSDVGDVAEVVLYQFPTAEAAAPPQRQAAESGLEHGEGNSLASFFAGLQPQYAVAVVDRPGAAPYPYVIGITEAQGRELANDLVRRLDFARRRRSAAPLPPVRVQTTTPEELERLSLKDGSAPASTVPRWARWPQRLTWVLPGCVGFVALAAAFFLGPQRSPGWVPLLVIGGVVEWVLLPRWRTPEASRS